MTAIHVIKAKRTISQFAQIEVKQLNKKQQRKNQPQGNVNMFFI